MSFETVPIFTNPPGLNQGLCGHWEVTAALASAAGLQLISSAGHAAWVFAAHLADIPDQSTTRWGCQPEMSPCYAKVDIADRHQDKLNAFRAKSRHPQVKS